MAKSSQELLGVVRGLRLIIEAGAKIQDAELKRLWQNSSIRSLAEECASNIKSKGGPSGVLPSRADVYKTFTETVERLSTVTSGFKEYSKVSTNFSTGSAQLQSIKASSDPDSSKNLKDSSSEKSQSDSSEYKIKLSAKDKEILEKLDMEYAQKIMKENALKRVKEQNAPLTVADEEKTHEQATQHAVQQPEIENQQKAQETIISDKKSDSKIQQVVPAPKARPSLSTSAKQRKVPSSRIARMVSFGSLAAGLSIGTATEMARRTLGFGASSDESDDKYLENAFLSPANMNRIVDTLCKVRGAALKIGQLLSIQDETLVSPTLAKALERVRQSADFMPIYQVEEVLNDQLGPDWRLKVADFDMKPFAAASIGQVHWAKLHDGTEVAMKIQYPGVAKGIESDIDNLIGIMKVWNIFPRGMFVDNLVTVAKRELGWEVNYLREAECTRKFRNLLEPYPDFYVPKVIDELCSERVFTTELVEGVTIDKCFNADMKTREFVTEKTLELTIRELLEFQYMQTDPNWANFLYNEKTNQIMLLDFGASRAYSKDFMDQYVQIIKAASDGNRQTVLELSRQMGFLTGYESEIMEQAHVDAVMVFGEMFRTEGKYDFNAQETTLKIRQLVPTMLQHRLCPPPEEIYSLHRKLSGVFLLCSKMGVSLSCRDLFLNMYQQYKFTHSLN